MKKFFLSFVVISFMLLNLGCKKSPIGPNETLSVSIEDVSCTEAWVKITTTNYQTPNTLTLFVNDKVDESIMLNSIDTLLYIDSLLPNQSYKIKAAFANNNQLQTTNEVIAKTMDTTSHNFTWQTFTFGEHSSSTLYDVAIIDENNIWAVGEIYMNDSLGKPDPNNYNAAHWNGSKWELIKIAGSGGWVCRTVFAFSENNIWFEGTINWDGKKYSVHNNGFPLEPNGDGWQINKMWGTSNSNLYAVGNTGNIAHYDGKRWQKIESGTDVDLKDIYGTPEGKTVWISGYEDFKPTVLLKISNSIIETVFSSRDYLFIFESEHISGGIGGVWTNNNNFVYLTSWYSLYRKSIYSHSSQAVALRSSNPTIFFGLKSRGTDINNIFTIGSRNNIHHYNGVTFTTYEEPPDNNVTYYGLDVKTNLSVLCGQKFKNGISDKAIITLIK